MNFQYIFMLGLLFAHMQLFAFDKLAYQKKQIETFVNEKIVENESFLNENLVGRELFVTSETFCRPISIDAMVASIKRTENQKKLNEQLGKPGFKATTLEELKKISSQINEPGKFSQFEKAKIEEVKVFIYPMHVKTRDMFFRFKEGDKLDLDWNGSSDIFITVAQNKDKFVVRKTLFNMKNLSKSELDNYFFDSEKDAEDKLDCFSKSDPIKKNKLSKKELDSIKNKSVFVGMSETALLFAVGRPAKINRTNTSKGTNEQWVSIDDKRYYYMNNGKLKSWQD